MTSTLSGKLGSWGRPQRKTWLRVRWLPVVLTIMAAGLTACGEDDREEAESGGETVTPSVESTDADARLTTAPEGSTKPLLIKTRIIMFDGEVLPGSVIGDAPFCPGGSVRHERGSEEVGFPAINVFRCPDGQLEIGFGPGPDQMNNSVQSSNWRILMGSGQFAGISGEGQMVVRFDSAGSPKGQETFTGLVVVP